MKAQTKVKPGLKPESEPPLRIEITEQPKDLPTIPLSTTNNSAPKVSTLGKPAGRLTPPKQRKGFVHCERPHMRNLTQAKLDSYEELNYDSVLAPEERGLEKSMTTTLRAQLEGYNKSEEESFMASDSPLNLSRLPQTEDFMVQPMKDFSVRFNHPKLSSSMALGDPLLNSSSDFAPSKPTTPVLTYSQNMSFFARTSMTPRHVNMNQSTASHVGTDSIRSTIMDFSKTTRINSKPYYMPTNTYVQQNAYRDVTKNVVRHRDMLKRAKRSLEESDAKVLGLRSEVEELMNTAKLLNEELRKWNSLNAGLREKMTYIALTTLGSSK